MDLRNYLFNGQEEGNYLFGQGIINEASIDDNSYNFEEKALIVSLLTNRKLVRTPQTATFNTEFASWWKGNAKSDSSSLPSMMFEDNLGRGFSGSSPAIFFSSENSCGKIAQEFGW